MATSVITTPNRTITVNVKGLVGGSSSGGSGSLAMVFNETPTGSVNGSNATFVTANTFVSGKIQVSINGIDQRPGVDFTTTGGNIINFTSSPEVGDVISTDYLKI